MSHLLKILAFIIFFSASLSCKKVIDIELPQPDPKIVVNSFFTEDSRIKVHLSKTIGILESIPPDITDASVMVRENGVIIDTMYLESGYYYSHILAERNNNYSLEVIAPGLESIFCEDIIPEKTVLQSYICTDSVLIDEDGLTINELKLDFQDLSGPSFYEVELETHDVIYNYNMGVWFEKNSDPIITSTGLLDYNPQTLVFTDKMFDGKHCSVKIYFATDPWSDYNLKISFRSVSESYYKYKEKQFAYLFSLHNDIFSGMSEPINLYSNITGGYGIFAGYSSDEKVIIVR
ncbi:MAG: DUF4249 domain-containing protein [Bacteroidales bacterium]|nr:DUF4249 domain-containing protein [Bacteroidales bacterium]MBK8884810.1 DUF4249 domain-containing protein [Bacteroidales bacterium]